MSLPWFYEDVLFDEAAASDVVTQAIRTRAALYETMTTRWHAAGLALGHAVGPFADELETGVRDNVARLDRIDALLDDLLAGVHRARAAFDEERHRRLALRALHEEAERDRQRATTASAAMAANTGARP